MVSVALGLLVAVISLIAEDRLSGVGSSTCSSGLSSWDLRALEHRLSTWGAQASLLLGMWDLPGSEIKPVFSRIDRQILYL